MMSDSRNSAANIRQISLTVRLFFIIIPLLSNHSNYRDHGTYGEKQYKKNNQCYVDDVTECTAPWPAPALKNELVP